MSFTSAACARAARKGLIPDIDLTLYRRLEFSRTGASRFRVEFGQLLDCAFVRRFGFVTERGVRYYSRSTRGVLYGRQVKLDGVT